MFDPTLIIVFVVMLVMITGMVYALTSYKRCPPNKILVVYGKVAGGKTAVCVHGGGAIVLPVIQDYMYLSLEPMAFGFDERVLTRSHKGLDVEAKCSVAISRAPEIMQNAAERLLGLERDAIAAQARDIVVGQTRLAASECELDAVIDRPRVLIDATRAAATEELNKIGLEIVSLDFKVVAASESDAM